MPGHGNGGMKTSLHGGHSGQFCDHARDTLAEVVTAYAAEGFSCVGLSEHMPPPQDDWMYADERELGRSAVWMQRRFAEYVAEALRLRAHHAGNLRLLVGMESEWYPGVESWIQALRDRHELEYVVGSLHHVQGVCFDYSREEYLRATRQCGSRAALYEAYFDEQRDMLLAVRPEVVGHFDLIRLYDPEYPATIALPRIWDRVLRNLELIRSLGAVLDINARALLKGQPAPYVCAPVMHEAVRLGIPMAYGDDAHGAGDVGCGYELVSQLVRESGADLWEATFCADRPEESAFSRPAT